MSELISERQNITSYELLRRDLGRLGIQSKNGLSERNRFVKKFEWIPHWKAEVTIALRGLPVQFNNIIGRMPEPYPAARDSYHEAVKYWQESGLALHRLDQALVHEDESTPSVDKIRGSFVVRAAMAEFSLAHRHFDEFVWHPTKRDRKNQIPNQITDARLLSTTQDLAKASDDRLYAQWLLARHSEEKRYDFWHEQLVSIQDDPWVQEVQYRNSQREP